MDLPNNIVKEYSGRARSSVIKALEELEQKEMPIRVKEKGRRNKYEIVENLVSRITTEIM